MATDPAASASAAPAPRSRRLHRFVLDRLVLREVLVPTALGFVTYTFLLLMRGIFGLMEEIFVRGIPASDALRLLAATVPHVVVLTIPMSFLFGVLLAMARMNGDNEITALQAGGIAAKRVLRPVLLLGFALTAFNAYLTLVVMPESNRSMREMRARFFSSARALARVEPKVFYEGFPNLLLYVDDISEETGFWRGVLLYDRTEPGRDRLILADRGVLVNRAGQPTGDGTTASEPWLLLEEVETHELNPDNPATYRVNQTTSQMHKLFTQSGTVEYRLGMRERSTSDLLAIARSPEAAVTPEVETGPAVSDARLASIELQKRLAIPVACLAFALAALPLGIGARSGGRGRGFILSVLVILAYYVMLNNGEVLALEGKVPVWVGVWLPNLVVAALGLVLMRRMGRWLGERDRGGWIQTVTTWLRRRRRRRSEASPVTGAIPIGTRRRFGPRFPTLLDRYVVVRLLGPLVAVLATTMSLYVIVDLADKIEHLSKTGVPFSVFVAYYWNLLPQVALDVTPIGLLIAVLILVTVLERRLELTAVKAAGISLFRLSVPIMLVAAAGAAGLWALEESVVPVANREAQRLLDVIKGREGARSYGGSDRQWLFSRGDDTLYNFLRFEPDTATMIRFTMFRFGDGQELRFHLFADRVQYQDGVWIASTGWFRQVFPDGTDEFRRITAPMRLEIPEDPTYFAREHRQPSEMDFRQLADYIEALVDSGYRPVKLLVHWHQKVTYPLSAFIMVLLALPFGLNRTGGRRVTAMQGVALALILGIGYFILVALFGKMGEADILPPLLGAWAPVVLGLLLAINRLTTLRT